MKRVSILRAFGLLVVLVAHVPRAAAQCAIELTDLTDRSTAVPSTSPAFRPFTYRAVASGATSSYEVFLSVRTRGSVFPLTYLTIVGTCPATNMCELRAWCIPEGAYDVSAAARCDGNNANVPSKVLPLDIDYEDPVVEITGTSKLPDGRYRIEFVWTHPTGLRAQSYSWNVQQRLDDGTYAAPVYSQTPDVTAAPGDRIGVTFSYCTDDQTRFAHDEAIVGAAPPTVSVSVLDGDGQSVEVGQAAAAPLRVRFTASDPSFNLASLSATFELISVPAGASGYGIGATAQSTSPVSYTAPVAADGTASATLVVGDQEGPYVVRVVSPLSQTGSAAIFTTIATGAPRFAFELPPGAPSERMLVRKHRDDDSYPSQYQIPTSPALRPLCRFPGVVTVAGRGVARDVWLRVVDPPDPSPYIPPPSRADDNKDPSPKGVLRTVGCAADDCRATSGRPLKARSGADGKVEVILEGTDRYGGDNYQIEASLDAQFTCATGGLGGENICAKSAIVMAWKRVYVEVHKMFTRGTFLPQNVPAGSTVIPVLDITQFPSPPFRVRLIHAPDAVGGNAADFRSEEVTVRHVEDQRGFIDQLLRRPGPGRLHLRSPNEPGVGDTLASSYDGPESVAVQPPQAPRQLNRTNRPYLADALGVVTGTNADFSIVDPVLLKSVFEEAFVEFVYLKDAQRREWNHPAYERVIPYVEQLEPVYQREWMARKWMRNAARNAENRLTADNHQILFFAHRSSDSEDRGLTRVGDGFNDLWILADSMSSGTRRESIVHEMGHQWRVNQETLVAPLGQYAEGHCDVAHRTPQRMYGSSSLFCTMTGGNTLWDDVQSGDGRVGFHYTVVNGQPESEYLRIRERAEPVPQNDNPVPRRLR